MKLKHHDIITQHHHDVIMICDIMEFVDGSILSFYMVKYLLVHFSITV